MTRRLDITRVYDLVRRTPGPWALDTYCCAGGATRGYQRAGFRVVGADRKARRNYCGDAFIQVDALDLLADTEFVRAFVLAAGSPPCQFGTSHAKRWGTADQHENLIPPTRELMQASGVPYVIENIENNLAHLVDPIVLCGDMFGLGVFRHRGFEAGNGITLVAPPHPTVHGGRIGDGKYVTVTGKSGGKSSRDGIQHGRKADWQRAMGIDWMSVREMAQAIPPAYTEWIGRQVLASLATPARAA